MIFKTKDGFKVRVFDHGFVTMCEWDETKHDFVDCVFSTEQDAQKALDRYNEVWNH